jgi:hypothetical protein
MIIVGYSCLFAVGGLFEGEEREMEASSDVLKRRVVPLHRALRDIEEQSVTVVLSVCI